MEKTLNPETQANAAKENRRQKLDKAVQEVGEKYPDLKEKIARSLETPQLGEYHKEGPTMDAHLALILDTLEAIKDGQFGETIKDDIAIQEVLKSVVVVKDEGTGEEKVNGLLVDYTLLHDIAKSDCLTLKFEGDKKGTEITWEEWVAIRSAGEPFQHNGKIITSISYNHASKESAGKHGKTAVEQLKDKNIPPVILNTIGEHEVAVMFAKINAAVYEKHFVEPGFSDEQQKFILAASYIDAMASIRADGKPDMADFVHLVRSRDNYLLIKKFVDRGSPFRDNDLQALKKSDKILTDADVEKIIVREVKYDLAVLSEKLDALVADGTISPEEKGTIVSLAETAPKEIGKKFGAKMKLLKFALDASKE